MVKLDSQEKVLNRCYELNLKNQRLTEDTEQ